MKKNLNIIQIKGIRGLILAGFVLCCLFVGFIVFPGWLSMNIWNCISDYLLTIPTIGLFQGVLLWGILLASYFIFRKEKVVVCMKSPQGLSDEELKSVFAEMRRDVEADPIIKAMLKAREAELKYKAQQELKLDDSENTQNSDTTNVQ